MSTSIPESIGSVTRMPDGRGVRALAAAGGGSPDEPCVEGELVWTSDLCDDRPCQCEWAYNGVASGGITMIAEVHQVAGADRAAIRGALVQRMGECGYPPAAARARVDRLLRVASALPVGTLLRLEHGVPVPFPPGSRLKGRGTVIVPASGGRR